MSVTPVNAVHGGDTYGLDGITDFSSNVAPACVLSDPMELLADTKLVGTNFHARLLADRNSPHCNSPTVSHRLWLDFAEVAGGLNTYPDPHCRDLRAALASRYGVSAETIVCGNGASDLIYRIVAASRPRVGATLPCTFSEYGAALRLFGADVVMWSPADMGYAAEVVSASVKANESAVAAHTLPLRSGVASASATATEGVLAADDAKVYFVCNPNNPTSELVDHASLVALADQCERTDAVLVVDECFMEFVDEDAANSLIPLLATHRNLVVLRAFTKSYALPGVRLGYALCGSPELTQQIAQSGPPWSVSALAQSIGLAALCDPDYLSHMRAWISAERPRFVAELTGTGVEVYPPQANFVLFRISESRDPQRFFADVLAAGFLLRRCTDFHGLDERHFRSAIKTPEQNNQLLAAIRAALKRA